MNYISRGGNVRRFPQRGQARTVKCDYSRTCEGCEYIRTEEWTPNKSAFRCFAPGRTCGYVVGVERFLPYIPAWCPKNKEELK